ncbi:MAG TPA: RNA methyltransferase [Bryobacteraceae bacterium]|jgi:TrmH family RNA methyltransferase
MRQPEIITSSANPLLKEVRRAISRGELTSRGWCVAETIHLLEEALRSDCRVQAVITGETMRTPVQGIVGERNDVRMLVVPDKLLQDSSQGVVTLVEFRQTQKALESRPLSLIVDGVQDPGNLGTIIRSAEAFGASALLLMKGTVYSLSPKVVRASAGSVFRVHIKQCLDDEAVAGGLWGSAARVYAAVPNGAISLANADLTGECAVIVGSEGHGIRPALRALAQDVTIPTMGVESLNAAVAASIILYEARRQRSGYEPV